MKKFRATSNDVARRAGVSRSTVSRAFSAETLVSGRTRDKILKAAAELGYKPNALARSLISRKSSIVAVVIGDLINPFHALATQRIVERLRSMHLVPFVFQIGDDAAKPDYWQAIEEYQPAAILVTALNVTPDVGAALGALDTPCILFNRSLSDTEMPSLAPDLSQGGQLAATHLVRQGCRRIAIVGGPTGLATAEQRMEGFLRGLELAELAPVRVVEGDYRYGGGTRAADRIFSSGDMPDGVLCANDLLAFGLIDQARNGYGIKIPEDVLVVGFDGSGNSAWGAYDLTTIELPLDRMLDSSEDLLTSILDGVPPSRGDIVLECSLVVRGSTRRISGR